MMTAKSQREWLAGLHEMRRIEINNGRNPFIASLSFQLRRVKKSLKTISQWVFSNASFG